MTCNANDNECMVLGSYDIRFRVIDKIVVIRTWVIPSLPILGADFWRQVGIVPDLGHNHWTLSNEVETVQVACITNNEHLSGYQKDHLDALINKISKGMPGGLVCTPFVKYSIKTKTDPIKQRFHPMPPALVKYADRELNEMFSQGVTVVFTNSHGEKEGRLISILHRLQQKDDFVKDISTQTLNAYEPECNRILHGAITNPVNGKLRKRRIAFISDHKGKGMAGYIMSLAKEEFIIESTVKPGASDRELADTVLNNTKNYNKNDLVIFWPNLQNRRITTELMMLKPQLIVITNPYKYSSNSDNDFVYNNNLEMKKHMFEAKKCSNIFGCNTTLKRWHYRGDGYGFTGSAKWLMSKALVRYIHNYFQPVYTIAPDNLPKLNTKSNPSMNVSLMSELQDAEQNANTKPGTNGTFLYPRLSQVAPDL
ncbi:hypothetical protein JTB14_027026 [Gonioctena quinquepunctata]|nr:hypothetical protein JTB14_027026 [Gonioctena quinquepunctata]